MECSILDLESLAEIREHKLVIYGAGQYGGFLYALLELKGMAENSVCFVVTDSAGNAETFCGKPVRPIDSVKSSLKDCVMILALGERACNEVLESMQGCRMKGLYRVNGQTIQDIRKILIAEYWKLPIQKNKIV